MSYQHLTIEERESIHAGIHEKKSIREISRELGRSASTISREIKRYVYKSQYSPSGAQKRYAKNRKHCRQPRKLETPLLREKVRELFLGRQWSPEEIAERLTLEESPFQISYATIYRGIYAGLLEDEDKSRYARGVIMKLRRNGNRRRRKSKSEHRGKHFFTPSISQRPEKANDRSEIGHFEGDTVQGKRGTGAALTIVDRKSRFLIAAKLEKSNPTLVQEALRSIFEKYAGVFKSITFDRGQEFRFSDEEREEMKVSLYFAHPYSSWERGTNENTNGLLREYMPKRTSFEQFTDEDVQNFVFKLNTRPRKCLGWKTPFEVFFDTPLHLT